MEAVSASIDALKKAAVGSKDKSVKAAAAELGQILTLLGSSSSPQKRAKLKTIFADKLYALYPAFLRQMCQFCANVLQAIYHEKVKPAFDAGDNELQLGWELVQKAVVSSVLDFLDQNQKDSNNKSNKDIVADAFYAVFCAMFYPPKPTVDWKSPSLIFNVNLLLSETATNHVENQKRLRAENVLGTAKIRNILSQSKEFFVLDSLVALVGVLLPARESAVKRTQFVDAIFKPELFPASAEIKELIATAAGADWDPIATGIINCFAKTDLSCPQPFVVNGFRTDTSAPVLKMVDPLYVDNHGLYTNVEKDGTYQVPFSTIERVKIGVPGTPWTPVSIQLSAEPLIGPVSEIVTAKKKCTMQFQLKNKDAGRFLQALKARGLNKLISDTKVSKIPEGVSLTFDSGARKPAQTREEKVTKIAQVWDSGVESGRPTSPLVPNPYETPGLKHDSSSTNSDLAEPCSQHDAMDGDELTDVSDAEGKATSKAKPPATKMTTPPRRVRVAEDSDDEQRAPIKPRPRKSAMKNRMIESDEEGEMEGDEIPSSSFSNGKDQDFEPTQPVTEYVPADAPARVTRGAAKKNPALATEAASKPTSRTNLTSAADEDADDAPPPGPSVRRQATRKSTGKELSLSEDEMEIDTTEGKPLATTKEPVAAGITTKKRSTGKADPIQVKTEIASKPAKLESKNGPKRLKADEEEASDGENEDEPSRPAKRLRGQIAAAEEPEPAPAHRASAAVFGTVTHAPVKKRYGGKKGRTSSPVPDSIAGDTDMNIDYDELPTAPSPLPSPIVKAEKKAKQQPKTVSDVNDARKGRVAAMRGKGGQKPAAKAPPKATKAAGKTKAKAPVLDASDDVECDDDVKPPRRSTRTNAAPKAEESTIETKVPKPKPKTKPEKPRKAPWEDMHLQKKEDVAMADDPLPQNDDVAMQDELQTGSDEVQEYYVPLKGSIDSSQDDVPMFDLTQNTPPKTTDKTVELDKAPAPPAVTPARSLDSTSAMQLKSTSTFTVDAAAVPVESASALATSAVPVQSGSTLAVPANNFVPTVRTKPQGVVDLTSPIRSRPHSPVAESKPVPLSPMKRFKPELPSPSVKLVSFRQKVASPAPPPTPPKPVHLKKTSPLRPIYPPQSPRSPTSLVHQKVDDSPFPQRVYQTVAFAPTKASPPSIQRNDRSTSARYKGNHGAYERTPDMGHPATTFGRGLYKHETEEREHDYKRSRSPMQEIIEKIQEIGAVIVENITHRFDHVRKDVRIGRDTILRGATANLEVMCAESESHFNVLVDLEEEYAAFHRKIISGMDNMQKNAELFSDTLGDVVQHHDRRSLSKKMPASLFTLPSTLRKPVVLL